MGITHDILFLISDERVYDSRGIKNNLVSFDSSYEHVTICQIDECIRRMWKNKDIELWTETRGDGEGYAYPGTKLLKCRINKHGLTKIEYLIEKGKVRAPK